MKRKKYGVDDEGAKHLLNIQTFFAYITATKTTLTFNTESTYDWEGETWSVPLNFYVSQLLLIGSQPISVSAGARYWADSPESGHEGWGAAWY